MSTAAPESKIPTLDETRERYTALGQYDFVVPGGGHGAASVCRALLDRDYTVAGVANPIDEGGHSAGIRWDMRRYLGYWPVIPGDTMNLLGGGFAHPALYAVVNSRLPKETGGRKAPELFSAAVDAVAAKRPASDRPVLEAFQRFLSAIGEAVQEELVEPGLVKLPGASLQNVLHVGTMVHAGAYRKGLEAVDEDRYLCGSWLLEREMLAASKGRVIPMSFDKVTLVTQHAGGRKVVGGINRLLLARGPDGALEYGGMVPNFMLPDAPPESAEEELRKLKAAKVVDWYAAEVVHGPADQNFNDDWVFQEVRPVTPRVNPELVRVLRSIKPGGSIVIPPGNAHESTYTFFVLGGLWEELQAAKARGVRVVLVCNPVNLLLTAGYSVEDYLGAIEQALGRASGHKLRAAEIIDRVVVNDPSACSEKVQRVMRGEGVPREVKQVLLHRTPTGPICLSKDEKSRLEGQGIEVVERAMLSVETISIRGIETEAISYSKNMLVDAIAGAASGAPARG
ncbi:MAG: 2-phospho-L-lactate transferase CofD family protein [Bryobacteraceae bacterium]